MRHIVQGSMVHTPIRAGLPWKASQLSGVDGSTKQSHGRIRPNPFSAGPHAMRLRCIPVDSTS
jgi:hypothetical protein